MSATPPYVKILSTGSYVPDRVITNAEVSSWLGEDVDQWLVDNVGIRERRWMAPDQVTSDLVVAASQQALDRAGLTARDIDLVLLSTDTPDQLSPCTAARVQDVLGADRAGCSDVNAACAGWVTALDLGARWLLTEPGAKHVLVAGGYGISRYVDRTDKRTAGLFADGAGAAVITRSEAPGWLGSELRAVGSFHDALGIYTGGTRRPHDPEHAPAVQFVRKFPKTFNVERWPPLVEAALGKAGLRFDDVDMFLLTQLNLRTIEAVLDAMGQPHDKARWVMDKWGYTGSPCVVMALHDAIERGTGPAVGDEIVFCASGGGITLAASVWRWV
ncbi:MAG: ketoacyl-ACP synthase III [Myxococcota bacterium]